MAQETDIVEMMASEYSWEQIIYKIISLENLDPWNVDLKKLSEGFLKCLAKMKELDFKIPAKYIIIACVLLRMKSDGLRVLDVLAVEETPNGHEVVQTSSNGHEKLDLGPLELPMKRHPTRRVMVAELIASLRKALRTEERRIVRHAKARGQINVTEEDIEERIAHLYRKIDLLLLKLKGEEVPFSKLVSKWEKAEVANTFLPLIYLYHDGKVSCKQEGIFDEIFIKKNEEPKAAKPSISQKIRNIKIIKK
ncbi:MAG: segregation/condensation protein A [Candidatus Aenigmarchaeota archaeon]|nr:segregation/condensation protein A [Candidatus Aenigmarchaeota archaeon]